MLHSTLIPLISPRITKYYTSGEHKKMESLLRVSSTFVFFLSLLYTTIIFFYSGEILEIWNVNTLEVKLLLIIIFIANLTETITGACGFTLIATNNEKNYY